MGWNGKEAGCLDDAAIEALAVRMSTAEEAVATPLEGPQEVYPADLFLPGEEAAREHLAECEVCRHRLWLEIHFLRDYRSSLDQPELVARYRARFCSLVPCLEGGVVDEGVEQTLYFIPREDLGLGEFRLAAATAPEAPIPASYSSRDGNLLLVESRDRAGARRYRLIGGAPDALKFNADLMIGDMVYRSDARGFVDFAAAAPALTPDTVIVVRASKRGL